MKTVILYIESFVTLSIYLIFSYILSTLYCLWLEVCFYMIPTEQGVAHMYKCSQPSALATSKNVDKIGP